MRSMNIDNTSDVDALKADPKPDEFLADAHVIEGELPGDLLGGGLGNGENPSDPP